MPLTRDIPVPKKKKAVHHGGAEYQSLAGELANNL